MNQATFQGMANVGVGAPMAMQPAQAQTQISQMVVETIKQHHQPQGWQTSVSVQERAIKVLHLLSSLRLIRPPTDLRNLMQHALEHEAKEFQQATDKAKLVNIRDARQRQAQSAQQQQQRQQAPQMGTMGPNGGHGPIQGPGQAQPNFPPQLQHPMQASPIPNRPPHQQMAQALDSMAVHAPLPQPHPQHPPQPQQFPPNGARPLPQPQHSQGPEAFTQQDNAEISALARHLAQRTSRADLEKIKANLSRMPDQQRVLLEQQGTDPLNYFFRQQAAKHFIASRHQSQQALPGGITGNGFPQASQQQIPRANMGVQGLPAGVVNGTDSFFGSLENFVGQQQANAMSAAEAGQPVVPASTGQRIPPESMAGFPNQLGLPQAGQQDPIRAPRMMPNPNATAQHQQQLFNAQQEQRERMQQLRAHSHAQAQAQAQAQVQAQAQMRAQHMASLHAQSSGMNPQTVQTALHHNPPQTGNPVPRPSGSQVRPNPSTTPQPRPQAGQQQAEPRTGQSSGPHEQRLENLTPGNIGTNSIPRPSMPLSISESLRAKINSLPEEQRRVALARLYQHHQQQQQGGTHNQQLGRPEIPSTTMPPNPQHMQGQQILQDSVMQHPVPGSNQFAGIPPARPGFPMAARPDQVAMGIPTQFPQPQPPAPAAGPPSQPLQPQGRRQQPRITAQPLPPDKVREMDAVLFPRDLLRANAKTPMQVPDHVKTWGQLKRWVEQNPQLLPAGVLEKIGDLQALHLQLQEPGTRPAQPRPEQQLVPPQNPMMGQAPAGPTLPAGGIQSPYSYPGQISTTTASQPNMAPATFTPIAQPTAQDVAMARSKLPEQTRQMSDDQVKSLILQIRIRSMQARPHPPQMANGGQVAQMTPQQYNQQTAIQRAHQLTQLQQEQQRQLNQGPRPSGPAQPQGKPPGQPAGQTQAQQAPTSTPRNQSNQKPGRNGQQGAAEASAPTQPQLRGVKRSSNGEELAEASPPKQSLNASRPQRTQSRMGASSAQQPRPVPLEQKAQAETRSQAQAAGKTAPGGQQQSHQVDTSGSPNAEQLERLRLEENQRTARLMQDVREASANEPKRPEIAMDREAKEVMGRTLRDSRETMARLERSLPIFFRMSGNEAAVKELMRIQVRDKDFTPKESFTITLAELEQMLEKVRKYLMSMARRLAIVNEEQSTTSQRLQFPPGQFPVTQPPMQGQIHPLSAANLQQQQEAYQRQRQQPTQPHPDRKQQAPPAPTSGRPPFQMPASSPHGIPQAYGKSDLTQDKLKFPPNKKRRGNQQGSNPSTPGQGPGALSATSPQLSKLITPAVNQSTPRHTNHESVHPHKCSISSCEYHVKGFASAEDLAKHEANVHEPVEPPIDDPMQYAFESVAEGLGLNKDGTAKSAKEILDPVKIGVSPAVSSQSKTSTPSRTGQEAISKSSILAATTRPLPQLSQGSVKSGLVASQSKGSQVNHVRTPASVLSGINSSSHKEDKEIDKTGQARVEQSGENEFTASPNSSSQSIPGLEDLRRCFEGLGDLSSLGFDTVRNISPKDTPSSKESQSTPNSNISENDDLQIKIQGSLTPEWNPFGINDGLSGDMAGMDIFDMDWDKVPTGSQIAAFATGPGTFASYGIDANVFEWKV